MDHLPEHCSSSDAFFGWHATEQKGDRSMSFPAISDRTFARAGDVEKNGGLPLQEP